MKKVIDGAGKVIKTRYDLTSKTAKMVATMKLMNNQKRIERSDARAKLSKVKQNPSAKTLQKVGQLQVDPEDPSYEEYFGPSSYVRSQVSPGRDLQLALGEMENKVQQTVTEVATLHQHGGRSLASADCKPAFIEFSGSDAQYNGQGVTCEITVLRNTLLRGDPTGDIAIALIATISMVPRQLLPSGTVEIFGRLVLDGEFISRSRLYAGNRKFIAGMKTTIFDQTYSLLNQVIPVWAAVSLQLTISLPAQLYLEPAICSLRWMCIRYGPHLITRILFTGSVMIGFSLPVIGEVGFKASLIANGKIFDGYFPLQASFDKENFCLDILYNNAGISLDLVLRGSVSPPVKYPEFKTVTKCAKKWGIRVCWDVIDTKWTTVESHDFWTKTYQLTAATQRTMTSTCRQQKLCDRGYSLISGVCTKPETGQVCSSSNNLCPNAACLPNAGGATGYCCKPGITSPCISCNTNGDCNQCLAGYMVSSGGCLRTPPPPPRQDCINNPKLCQATTCTIARSNPECNMLGVRFSP